MSKIWFYEEEDKTGILKKVYHGYKDSIIQITNHNNFMTTQMCLLSTKLFTEYNYDEIEIIDWNGRHTCLFYNRETQTIRCNRTQFIQIMGKWRILIRGQLKPRKIMGVFYAIKFSFMVDG